MSALTYVEGAERMLTAARLSPDGLYVRFADDRDAVIPLDELDLGGVPDRVSLPRPHLIEIHLTDGTVEEVPWDFARHFADERYRRRSEEAATRGRRHFGGRLRELRSISGLSQRQLAELADISRVSVARMELGRQLPRYQTTRALASALDVPVERLLVD